MPCCQNVARIEMNSLVTLTSISTHTSWSFNVFKTSTSVFRSLLPLIYSLQLMLIGVVVALDFSLNTLEPVSMVSWE